MNDINLLLTRRSTAPKDLTLPGPTPEQRQQLLQAAHRVPDHGKLGPWRFVVFEGAARREFGAHLARIYEASHPQMPAEVYASQQGLLERAPLVIAVISTAGPHVKIPEWEQVLSAGAACQNLLVAAQCLGFGACWLTEWYSYHPDVKALLGLDEHHAIAGFVYIGTRATSPEERVRPALEDRLSYWSSASI